MSDERNASVPHFTVMSRTGRGKREITTERGVPLTGLEGRLMQAMNDPKILWFYCEREDYEKKFAGQNPKEATYVSR